MTITFLRDLLGALAFTAFLVAAVTLPFLLLSFLL